MSNNRVKRRIFTSEYYIGKQYPEYFKTHHWKKLTEQLIDTNKKASCWICSQKRRLLPHHVSYQNLFHERLKRDVYIVCFDCHTSIHFSVLFGKIPLEKQTLLRRMKLLKLTYSFRKFRLGSLINNFIQL